MFPCKTSICLTKMTFMLTIIYNHVNSLLLVVRECCKIIIHADNKNIIIIIIVIVNNIAKIINCCKINIVIQITI